MWSCGKQDPGVGGRKFKANNDWKMQGGGMYRDEINNDMPESFRSIWGLFLEESKVNQNNY